MDEQAQRCRLVRRGAALVVVVAAWLFVRFRLRCLSRRRLSYEPMAQRDATRQQNLMFIYNSDDTKCIDLLRMKRAPFFQLCDLFHSRELLKDSIHSSIEEQVAMFLHVVGHNKRFRVIGLSFRRSTETISRFFREVLFAVGELRNEMILPASSATPTKIFHSPRWNPFFKVSIGSRLASLRKWRSKWGKICRLKNLSAALWDENNFMISLDREHYNGHVKDHPKDAEFLNTPRLHYQHMEAIFGNGVATGRYAMGPNEPLDIPEAETIELDADTPVQADEDPLPPVSKPKLECSRKGKRKRVPDEDATLMGGLTEAIKGFSAAVSEAIPRLYQAIMSCLGFTREALMAALGHLSEKKAYGLMFVEMTADDRDLWLRTYLAKNYYM